MVQWTFQFFKNLGTRVAPEIWIKWGIDNEQRDENEIELIYCGCMQ